MKPSRRRFGVMLGRIRTAAGATIGIKTAVSTPRRVTTYGPFLMVASKNSLNRAFASCTCHEANLHRHLCVQYDEDPESGHKPEDLCAQGGAATVS